MSYTITKYTSRQALKIGVQVKPSSNKTKKIDVLRDGKVIASVGAKGYNDYPTFMKTKGKRFAKTRRCMYKQRHEKDRHTKGTAGYYADQLLW
jgi:hypothetical protein